MTPTDYDAPRRTEIDDVSEDSLEELEARRYKAQSAVVDVDESDAAESFELPGADLIGEGWRTPDVVLDRFTEIDLGSQVVQLWHFGPGNGPGDTIVYVPDTQVAWTGNFIGPAGFPGITSTSCLPTAGWTRTPRSHDGPKQPGRRRRLRPPIKRVLTPGQPASLKRPSTIRGEAHSTASEARRGSRRGHGPSGRECPTARP
jgi:hypothetical protein